MSTAPPLALPEIKETFLKGLAQLAEDRFGRAAPSGPTLAAAVREVSRRYTRDRAALMESLGDPQSLTARLRFFLPRDLYKVWGPLSELQLAGHIPLDRAELRVLDVGMGLGTSTLGLATFLRARGFSGRLRVVGIDSDPMALNLAREVCERDLGLDLPALELDLRKRTVSTSGGLPQGRFDVIVCGLALNEVLLALPESERPEAGAEFLAQLCERLQSTGSAVVLEPALRSEARTLQAIRDVLSARTAGPHVFAPCLGTAPCPMLRRDRDWCHERLPLRFPAELTAISNAAGLRDEELTYSYLTLRGQPGTLAQLADPDAQPYRVVGGPVFSKGKTEYELCGVADAPRLLWLDRQRKSTAAPNLDHARRGTVLTLGPGGKRSAGGHSLRLSEGQAIGTLVQWSKPEHGEVDPG